MDYLLGSRKKSSSYGETNRSRNYSFVSDTLRFSREVVDPKVTRLLIFYGVSQSFFITNSGTQSLFCQGAISLRWQFDSANISLLSVCFWFSVDRQLISSNRAQDAFRLMVKDLLYPIFHSSETVS